MSSDRACDMSSTAFDTFDCCTRRCVLEDNSESGECPVYLLQVWKEVRLGVEDVYVL